MQKQKEELLNQTFESFIKTCLSGIDVPHYEDYLAADIMGFGTAVDEKIYSLDHFKELLERSNHQMLGLDIDYKIEPLKRIVLDDKNAALFADDIYLDIKSKEETIQFYLRMTVVLRYTREHWKVVHWHGSKPEEVESHKDSWGVEAYKKKNEELEQLVNEKTADLHLKNRALEIEATLERIRSHAMAMSKSEDLFDVVIKMRQEFLKLDHQADYFWHMKWLKDSYEMAMTSEDGKRVGMAITIPKFIHDNIPSLRAWEKANDPYIVLPLDGKSAWDYIEAMDTHGKYQSVDPDAPSEEDIYAAGGITFIIARTTHGEIGYSLSGQTHPPEEDIKTLLRFAKVFDLAYKRFEDLRIAEEQAREAQIEAAIERVRSRSLAMHKSEELADLSYELVKQIHALGIDTWFCAFNIYDDADSSLEWGSNLDGTYEAYRTPREGIFLKYFEAGRSGETLLINEINEDDCPSHYEYLCSLPGIGKQLLQMRDAGLPFPSAQIDHVAYFKYGYVLFITFEQVTESHSIFKRFAKVFEQSYTRFLDLQKAEGQAREAQIEAALEKVRSASMAMHESIGLINVVNKAHEQIIKLGIDVHYTQIWTDFTDNPEDGLNIWVSADNREYLEKFHVPFIDHPLTFTSYNALTNKLTFLGEILDQNELKSFFKLALKYSDFKNLPEDRKKDMINATNWVRGTVPLTNSMLHVGRYNSVPFSKKDGEVLSRIGKVIQQSYTRFLDLKRAEAQTREAQVEMALEKVRSRTMAMQSSLELPEAANSLFMEVQSLGIPAWSAGYNILSDDKTSSTCIMSSEGEIQIPFTLPLTEHKSLKPWHEAIIKNKDFFVYGQDGDDLVEHYNYMKTLPGLEDVFQQFQNAGIPLPTRQFNHLVKFSEGFLLFITYEEVPDAHSIFKRFGKVFEQTYTRFLDLQKSEAQAQEAKVEMALEKVRSRTMAMESSNELAETSVIVFKQLLELGIAPNRLFIGIINESESQMDCWATNEDGTKLSNRFIVEPGANASIKKMIEGWKKGLKSLTIDMNGKELINYFDYLANTIKIPFIHGLEQKRRIQTLAYFSGGVIGMASSEEQPQDTIELLERFAAVFNLTFTRFKDLKIAEANAEQAKADLIALKAAKSKAEEALSELQTTQQQLIQSEKMASLGELTAGIAHEIQNPLNFVNNFSEVSKELLEEMQEEIENGDFEEVKAIMADVVQNLEKINHHGQRADSIVKGMLQHSRTGGEQKEPTDINKLTDEYLRLAYHGMRAKDKSFNADITSDFEKGLPAVSIIPQDIGRVLLNLLTNAFYACAERSRSTAQKSSEKGIENYKPIVGVSTKLIPFKDEPEGGSIEISISDNGAGIPSEVIDKIFQPFFTTKPTGEGTGLGLSMSYDIITKGHGGTLTVDSRKHKGTILTIQLPLK